MPIAPRVNPAPLPGARVGGAAPLSAFGGGAGNVTTGLNAGLSAVRDTATRIAREEKVRADQIAITAAGAELTAATTASLYGPNGALSRMGKDAFDTPETTREQFFGQIGQIRTKLTGEQADAFDQMVANQWGDVDRQLQRHVASQRQAYDGNQTDAAVSALQDQAVKGFADAEVVTASIEGIKANTTAYGARNGWSPEQVQTTVAKQVSAAHVGVLSQMLNAEQDVTAKTYFDAHRDEIAGADQAKVEKALQAGSTQGEAHRALKRILAGDATATAALAQAEAIDDPKVREETIQLVTGHFNNLDRVQRLDREGARARVIKALDAGNGRLNRGSSDWQLIDGYPEGEHVLARQQQILHPPKDEGDPDKYLSFVAMGATSPATRQSLLSTNIADVVGDATLNSGQKTAIINMIRSERQKDLTDLRRRFSDAQQEAKRLETIVKKARDAGDDDTIASNEGLMYAAKQRATILRGQVITATRTGQPSASGEPPTDEELAAEPPVDPRTSANPLGLAPVQLKPLTPDMTNDLATYGTGYADYLRQLGYAVPSVAERDAVAALERRVNIALKQTPKP